jgi:hypothetical protein
VHLAGYCAAYSIAEPGQLIPPNVINYQQSGMALEDHLATVFNLLIKFFRPWIVRIHTGINSTNEEPNNEEL